MAPKMIDMKCGHCGKTFQMLKKEHTRQTKRGRDVFFCSTSCSGHVAGMIGLNSVDRKNVYNIAPHCANRLDEYSQYREYIRRMKRRHRKKNIDFDIDIEYLKDVFEAQGGKCVVTGVDLIHASNINKNYMASVDRIDSSKGYVRGNIRFVSATVNYAKSDQTEEQLQEFLEIIRRG